MLVEELLRPLMIEYELQGMDDLMEVLLRLGRESRTAKLWVECFILPVFWMMTYVRAERESDWCLHLTAVEAMIPLFFAAGHMNYARYALYYLRAMHDLPEDIKRRFDRGEHTMHHNSGIFNGLWSDMAIETTFMRYGHSKTGIVGITLQPQTLKTWAYSLHTCHTIVNDLHEMRSEDSNKSQSIHKEEMPARMKYDEDGRKQLRDKLKLCLDPLEVSHSPTDLVHIVTGQIITSKSINVDDATRLGKEQMEKFEESWPDSFYTPIQKVVNTMADAKKHMKISESNINTEAIYARAMSLQKSSREINIRELMSYELSPVPTAFFDDQCEMRITKAKATLKNALKVETDEQTAPDTIFLDGCAILWVVQWPGGSGGFATVQKFMDNFRCHLARYLEQADVYLIFDRYMKESTKESARKSRDKGASRLFTLSSKTRLPAQSVVLTVSENKAKLIRLIIEDLILHKDEIRDHKLIVTGENTHPIELFHGQKILRNDLETTQEEADTIIVHQVSKVQTGTSLIIADDTDVFLLLLHYCERGEISSRVLIGSPIAGRSLLDIQASTDRHRSIIPDLLAAHALTGCDTVASPHGIGKMTALKVLNSGEYSLSQIGVQQVGTNISLTAIEQATKFCLGCYGQKECATLSEARLNAWNKKVAQRRAAAPPLPNLPPTDEGFLQNLLRAQLQVLIWRKALDAHPPAVDITEYGWSRSAEGSISPVPLPEGVRVVPEELLKIIHCSCRATQPCRSEKCSCKKSALVCSSF